MKRFKADILKEMLANNVRVNGTSGTYIINVNNCSLS